MPVALYKITGANQMSKAFKDRSTSKVSKLSNTIILMTV